MLGKPKYKKNERVQFMNEGMLCIGYIGIVDKFGTFDYSEDVSYDIYVDEGEYKVLYKHIPEKYVESAEGYD